MCLWMRNLCRTEAAERNETHVLFPLQFLCKSCGFWHNKITFHFKTCKFINQHYPCEHTRRQLKFYFSFHGALAPVGSGPYHYRGFTITLRYTTIGRTLDEWSAQTPRHNIQQSTQTDIQAPGGIRTRNRSKRAAADPPFRPRSHRDQPEALLLLLIKKFALAEFVGPRMRTNVIAL